MNSDVPTLIRALLTGGESNELESLLTKGVGLVRRSTIARRDAARRRSSLALMDLDDPLLANIDVCPFAVNTCCPLVNHVEYAPRSLSRLGKKDASHPIKVGGKDGIDKRPTDGRTPDRCMTLTARRGQRSNASHLAYYNFDIRQPMSKFRQITAALSILAIVHTCSFSCPFTAILFITLAAFWVKSLMQLSGVRLCVCVPKFVKPVK